MRHVTTVLLLVVLLAVCTASWAQTWVNLSDPSFPQCGDWVVITNSYDSSTREWIIQFQCSVWESSLYSFQDVRAYITYASYGGQQMTYNGNGVWTGNNAAITYIGPDVASYEMIDPNWYYAPMYLPNDFSKAYPTISLGDSAPGDIGVMTWTMSLSGDPNYFHVGSQMFGYATPVPEPCSMIALMTGLITTGALTSRRRKK